MNTLEPMPEWVQREFIEKYIRPAVERNLTAAAVFLYGEQAPRVFEPKAPKVDLQSPDQVSDTESAT